MPHSYLKLNNDGTIIAPYDLHNIYKDFPWEFTLDVSPIRLEEMFIFAYDDNQLIDTPYGSIKFTPELWNLINKSPANDILIETDEGCCKASKTLLTRALLKGLHANV